ncbi:hypothetical protein QFW77_12245 [Luteimonas sp. RD2P54]|uniref:Uncharacterized protein n=1 Tax=Luteimonas endophytica TaxID=3042023 RepID=A0ABT6JAA0_9GAMM|nr:hypothetical protein [Luteimonas endophytica]MDH5823756.1 hypothetical protein [Luteimonas endophytica]
MRNRPVATVMDRRDGRNAGATARSPLQQAPTGRLLRPLTRR